MESAADHERRADAALLMVTELQAVSLQHLAPEEAVTHALLRRELGLLVRKVETGSHLRPSLFPFGADMMALQLGSVVSLSGSSDADRYVAHLNAVPSAIASFADTLRLGTSSGVRYPRVVLARAAAQARSLIRMPLEANPLLDPFRRSGAPVDVLSPAQLRASKIVVDAVLPAIAAYASVIEHELSPVGRDSVAQVDEAGGEARYRLAIDLYASVNDSPASIHALGLVEVERLDREIDAVSGAAGLSGNTVALRRVAEDAAQISESGERLRERIESLAKRIDSRIPEIVGRLPRSTYGVRSIPISIAGSLPPAYAQPNPADNRASGTLWVSSMPAKLPAYLHPAITLHEGWPGHLMHLALIQEQRGLPEFQRYNAVRYSACLEGWALYCEWLGEGLGLYTTPLERYGRLDMEMWRACRLVVDTGLHTQGWSRERAVSFMRAKLTLPLSVIEAEVDRYIGWAGQALSYQLGNIAFRRLRQEAETALGPRFDVRAFHDCLMRAGPVTLPILGDIVGRWTAQEQARNEPAR